MRLVFSPANSAWMFMFGDAPICMHGYPMFFAWRWEAVEAAKARGLIVDRNGNVTVAKQEAA